MQGIKGIIQPHFMPSTDDARRHEEAPVAQKSCANCAARSCWFSIRHFAGQQSAFKAYIVVKSWIAPNLSCTSKYSTPSAEQLQAAFESDADKLKRMTLTQGFQAMPTIIVTLKGLDVMRVLRWQSMHL